MDGRHAVATAIALGTVVAAADGRPQLVPRDRPVAGTVRLGPGVWPDLRGVRVHPGGNVSARIAGSGCAGFVKPRPDVVLELRGRVQWLRVYVAAAGDTALVVRRPNGQISCNDDTFGRSPSVDGIFVPGRYQIWVATPQPGTIRDGARLMFTRVPAHHP